MTCLSLVERLPLEVLCHDNVAVAQSSRPGTPPGPCGPPTLLPELPSRCKTGVHQLEHRVTGTRLALTVLLSTVAAA